MRTNSNRRHLNRARSRLLAGRKKASFRRWCLAAGTSLMLSWLPPQANAQDSFCDDCAKSQACSTHAPLRRHSHCDHGVELPSLQTLFVDRLNAVGDRIERRVHRHHPRMLGKSCGHPDCTDCTAAAMTPGALSPSGVSGWGAESGMQTPFANSKTLGRLPAILRPSSVHAPALSRPEARGTLTDRRTELPSDGIADVIDAKQLTPQIGAPSAIPDPSTASTGAGSTPRGSAERNVGQTSHQPTSMRPPVASETNNRPVAATKPTELVDLVEPDATASRPTRPAAKPLEPRRDERPISTVRPENPGDSSQRTLETIPDATPVAPPERPADRFRALPSAPESPRRLESISSDLELPISGSDATREPSSGRPAEPKPMPHQDGLPEILVDPFQDDVRAVRPNSLGNVEQSSGVQPKPFPTRGRNSLDAGSLKAKFETAKRLNAAKSPLPPPLVLPPAASKP